MNLNADVGNKLMVMMPDDPVSTMSMPITIVMVVPIFVLPIVIGTILVSISALIVAMMIIPVVICTCRK
jgi:hypothetical protein